jgi:arsenite/tail-anchored protein-transporting ATPase
MLAQSRQSVLIVSTDPAHNLSDAFGQKFGKSPTKVNGISNLFAMEIDPKVEFDDTNALDENTQSLMAEVASSIPGIDEAMSFSELMKQVQMMDHDVIVFDTAPTGHTLRLLNFPNILQKGIAKLVELKEKFSGIMTHVQSTLQQANTSEEQLLARFETVKKTVEQVHAQFIDPDLTTFVCVCIPEFLSLFETERLVQELSKFDIDTHNIIVNQVLEPEVGSTCKKCLARQRMQKKYLDQICTLYEDDFHVTIVPQLDNEVRGLDSLGQFAKLLLNPPEYVDHSAMSATASSATTTAAGPAADAS